MRGNTQPGETEITATPPAVSIIPPACEVVAGIAMSRVTLLGHAHATIYVRVRVRVVIWDFPQARSTIIACMTMGLHGKNDDRAC